MTTLLAQGWYRDPYGVHQDRYFSAGTATKLVRDGGREAYDPPPTAWAQDDGVYRQALGKKAVRDGWKVSGEVLVA